MKSSDADDNVGDIFQEACAAAPSVIFFDQACVNNRIIIELERIQLTTNSKALKVVVIAATEKQGSNKIEFAFFQCCGI